MGVCSEKPNSSRHSVTTAPVRILSVVAPMTLISATSHAANVAATVALAGLGFDRTEVQLAADPGITENIHEVEAEGPSGRIAIRLEGRPDPDNPRTSALTALSLARAVLNLSEPWRI